MALVSNGVNAPRRGWGKCAEGLMYVSWHPVCCSGCGRWYHELE